MVETIYDCFEETVADQPDRPFMWYDGKTTSYREARAAVDCRATLLKDRGFGSDDRLGLLLPNDPELPYLLLAAAKRGVTAVPINYRQERDILAYLINDASLSGLVVDRDVIDNFTDIINSVEVNTVFGHDIPTDTTGIDEDLDEAVANVSPAQSDGIDARPDDIAVLNYTSGTTGPPKGVRNPHRAFVESGHRLVDTCGTGPADRALLVLPLFHANPMTYGLMHMISAGGSIAPIRRFSASEFWSKAREADATFFTHVGSVLEILWRNSDKGTNTETPLSFALGGAAGFKKQETFENRFDIQIVRLYGLSEVGAGLVTVCEYDPAVDHHPDHQGSVENAPFDVAILSKDGLSFVDVGERGEIVVRPEKPTTMFKGYLGKEAATVKDWQDLWMHTGDLGMIDKDGNLRFIGRIKTSIRTYGENVSPWEIESPLSELNEIEEVAAVGVPDEVAGEEILLFVVPAKDDIDPKTIHTHCQKLLPEHLIPRYINIIESMPKTSTQKIERVTLRDRGIGDSWDSEE